MITTTKQEAESAAQLTLSHRIPFTDALHVVRQRQAQARYLQHRYEAARDLVGGPRRYAGWKPKNRLAQALQHSFLSQALKVAYIMLKDFHSRMRRAADPRTPVYPLHLVAREAYHGNVDALEALGEALRRHSDRNLRRIGDDVPWGDIADHLRRANLGEPARVGDQIDRLMSQHYQQRKHLLNAPDASKEHLL